MAAGIHCGIKASGNPDLALVATATGLPVNVAAVFTSNKMTAAPVLTSHAHLVSSGGQAAAVILNSGNANAANGAAGLDAAERMCRRVAREMETHEDYVLVCSTGLIGIPYPIETVEAGIAALVRSRGADKGHDAAVAIMTTDTHDKQVVVHADGFTVGGMAKGAAMLAPNMATMLCVLTTDAAATPQQLKNALTKGIKNSFNAMVVDGCQSTNDTVILLASAEAGPVDEAALEAAVAEACLNLCKQMTGDAEGATKVVTLTVTGAASDEDARIGARAIAKSQLTKCSWYGCDPYWGRICSDLGASGIDFEQFKVSASYGGVTVAAGGCEIDHDRELVKAHMALRHLNIVADLGIGTGTATIFTNDLTHAYVDENMGTS